MGWLGDSLFGKVGGYVADELFGGGDSGYPSAPEYYQDPRFQVGIDDIFSESTRLRNLDFSNNPLMAETISLNPQTTDLALRYAEGSLLPSFNRSRQNTINELANLGSLESSTTADALARADYDLNSQLQSIVAGAGLSDAQRALSNRMNLFGSGLNMLQLGTTFAGQEQGSRNSFNQQNYENQIAEFLYNQDDSGGLSGALTGAIGGGMSGFMMGGPMGAAVGAGLGGVAGYAGPSGTGGQILNASSLIAGNGGFGGFGTGLPSYAPRSTAGVGDFLAKNRINQTPSFQNSGFSLFS